MDAVSTEKSSRNEQQNEVEEIIRNFERVKGLRGNWESHWQEIAERIWPSHSRMFQSGGMNLTQGEKRNEQLYDMTAAMALDKFGAILDSLLTPANQTWHRIGPMDTALSRDREVKLWFEELNRELFKMRYSPLSNFISQNQLVYKMEGAYGTGTLYVDIMRDKFGRETGLRYRNVHLSEIFFCENHQGIIDTAYRYYRQEARQMAQEFKEENLPAEVKAALVSDPSRMFMVIHCVKPRPDFDPERADYKGMPWSSHYVSMTGRALLEEGGYDTFPYPTARYEQVPGEVYGRSPAMLVLPAVKTLNEQYKTVLTQGHRAVSPVLLTHDDGIIDTFSMRPGAMNAGGVTSDGRPLVHALPVGSIAIGQDMMDAQRAEIKEPFLVPLFQILVENPTMTATEVMERAKEKAILLAPTVGRQYSEYHSPLIDREIALMARMGKLPGPIPRAILEAGAEYQTRYESPMTRSQRAEEASGGMRVLDTAISIAANTQNPEALDHFNFDKMLPDLADIHGVPAAWLRDPKEVAEMRQQRAQAAERETQIREAPGAAALVKADAMSKKAANG